MSKTENECERVIKDSDAKAICVKGVEQGPGQGQTGSGAGMRNAACGDRPTFIAIFGIAIKDKSISITDVI